MSIQAQIDRIKNNVTRSLAKVAEKGVTVPADANSDDLEGLIDAITGGGGSLTGIAAISSGTFTPTADIDSKYVINHGLDVTPNFYQIYALGAFDAAENIGCVYHCDCTIKNFIGTSTGATKQGYKTYIYVTSSGSVSSSVGSIPTATTYITKTAINFVPAGMCKLKAGTTYVWVAGYVDDLN